jgi:hypothetical protein
MNDLVVLGASAAVVAILVGIAVAAGFRVRGRLDEAAVRAAVARIDPRLRAVDILIDDALAIARLADGRFAIVRAMGDGASARLVAKDQARFRVRRTKNGLAVRTPGIDPGFPGGTVRAPEAPNWLTEHLV